MGADALFELVRGDPSSADEGDYAHAQAGAALLSQAIDDLRSIRLLLTPPK